MPQTGAHPLRIQVVAWFMLLVVAATAVELAARVAYHFRRRLVAMASLHSYEMLDPKHPENFLLRPGVSVTFGEQLRAARHENRALAVERLQAEHVSLNQVAIRINQDGFRGPEIDPSHSRPRVLCIGDSCTFGLLSEQTYPSAMAREFRRRGLAVEVVNGGVEGYQAKNVLLDIEHFRALRPEITTIYIGWNSLFSEGLYSGAERYIYSLRIMKLAYQSLSSRLDPTGAALAQYHKPKHPDRDAAAVHLALHYVSPSVAEVAEVAKQMRSAGSTVVLLTLPGLYTIDEVPSERALKVGHLPTYTDNPFVLAALTESYNASLRALAEKEGLRLIDLANWGKSELEPRDQCFFDSVHMKSQCYEKMGVYLADSLLDLVAKLPSSQRAVSRVHAPIASQVEK